ncbi:ABC transporter ATP-binding protein [Sphingomonas canadensis]|uniref:ABC transporter ATP-binding protein n=1 Tax=Sphingomonas canadensis TaxID=1219257 RepID=A0ABW3H894_9SPHN|nr:ABC transporter ATP-binding protein [Sphingomonas canadensis]MCW3836948.1 ABC transporter ATP-binding protein [Sphingomonas canadensis]
MSGAGPAIAIDRLSLAFDTPAGRAEVLDALSIAVAPGEIVGLIGESGSGKSVTATALLGLLPGRGCSTGGSVRVLGEELLGLGERRLEEIRGARIAMIFQEPMNALNPLLRIGGQLTGVIRRHTSANRAEAEARARELLADMQIRDVDRVMRAYPFMLSGGMRQRVLIAMAFACGPEVLVADEPTTALDVTVQAQVLRLLRDMARKRGTAVLLITHDIGVVRHLCDRIYVIHAGQIVEQGPTAAVIAGAAHPYTRALLASLPERFAPREPIASLDAPAVSPVAPPPGCRFAPRCAEAVADCSARPGWTGIGDGHQAACWRLQPGREA